MSLTRINRETDQRWRVVVNYRSDKGVVDVEHFVEEIHEVDEIIEAGPHWDTVIDIKITLNRPAEDVPSLTLEEAKRI